MTAIRKVLVVALALALLGLFFVGASGNAAATQNAPTWSAGNQWVYGSKDGSTSLTMTVKEQVSLTIGSTTYNVWHVAATTTTTSGGTSLSITLDQYYTTDGLKIAKTNGSVLFLGSISSTFDAPYPLAVFPLSPGNSWTGSSQETTQSAFGTGTSTFNWNGTVLGEGSVSVAAGTFTASQIWAHSGTTSSVYFYSEQVGWAVRIDSYSGGINPHYTGSMNLTSYNYSPGFLGISSVVWIVLLVVALIVIVGAVMLLRRRPRVPYPMQPPQQPYQPPQQPPPRPPGT